MYHLHNNRDETYECCPPLLLFYLVAKFPAIRPASVFLRMSTPVPNEPLRLVATRAQKALGFARM